MAMPVLLPDCLPIVAARVNDPGYRSAYVEPEVTRAVDLCDARGRLDAAAVGWSRAAIGARQPARALAAPQAVEFLELDQPPFRPLGDAGRHRLRRVLSAVVRRLRDRADHRGDGAGVAGSLSMPEDVRASVAFRRPSLSYANLHDGRDRAVEIAATARDGERIAAAFTIRTPPGQESLNLVVPWSAARFQLNCKENTYPAKAR